MATIVRELINVIGYKVDKKQLNEAEKKTQKLLGSLRNIGIAVGASILAIGASAIKVAGDMEALNAQFETMLGSAESASALMQDLIDFSVKTPFTPKQLANSAKVLLNFGVAEQDIITKLKQLGDISGGSGEKLQSLAIVFGQIQSTGKLMGQDLLQLINAGFNPLQVLSEKTGKSVSQLKDEMSKGAISADMVAEAFRIATSEGGKFYGNMERLSNTLPGLLSTLQGIVELSLADAVKQVEGEIKGTIRSLITLFETTVRPMLVNLMKAVAPLFSTLTKLLEPVFQLLTPILGILSTTLSSLANIIDSALMPLLNFLVKSFTPILEDVNEIFGEIMKIVEPLLTILMANLSIVLKQQLVPLMLQLKLILAILGPILKLVNLILGPFLWVFAKILTYINDLIDRFTFFFMDVIDKGIEHVKEKFSGFTEVFKSVFKSVQDFFIRMINWVIDKTNVLIEKINELPGITIEAIQRIDLETKKEESKGNMNVNQKNNINISTGSGDPKEIAKAVAQGVGTPFQIELKKIVSDL